ncbi:MAG: isoprenyl transferase [Lachnospiraceae bacterium]|nr:isoprenyl transferase [Lachnospiraceae bacterium]
MNVPNHIAIILDGNGRWAKSKGMPRNYGHAQGAKNVEVICDEAWNLGVKYLTVYAFSTENWSRPADEVSALMNLLRSYLKTCLKTAKKNNMSVRVIGDLSKLDQDLQDTIAKLTEATKDYDGLHFTVALNYGSQDEILRAVNQIIADREAGILKKEPVTRELLESYLDTKDLPMPDLLIRTSGEQRLSNFLLWQLAYAEFYFTPVHWPAFDREELRKAIEAYSARSRRFGGV